MCGSLTPSQKAACSSGWGKHTYLAAGGSCGGSQVLWLRQAVRQHHQPQHGMHAAALSRCTGAWSAASSWGGVFAAYVNFNFEACAGA